MVALTSADVLLDVSRETVQRLEELLAQTARWNPAINLVGRSTLDDGWARHIVDSAQLFALVPAGADHWADLGSGAGYPGLVIAILSRERAPGRRVTLVESDRRKATFLREIARDLAPGTVVVADRIEASPPLAANVLSARALAPLPVLCRHARRHLAPGGVALFPKGRDHARELAEARAEAAFTADIHPSRTDPEAAILLLKGLADG